MKQKLTFEEDDDNFIDKISYQEHIEEINNLTYMINSNMYLDKAGLYYKKGMNLSIIGNYSEAVECFNKALAINDNYSEAYDGKIQAIKTQSETQGFLKNKWYGEVKGEILKFKNFQELKIEEEQYKEMFKYLQPQNFLYILEHMDDTESEILGNLDMEYQDYL